jgi:Right handed beta helix region
MSMFSIARHASLHAILLSGLSVTAAVQAQTPPGGCAAIASIPAVISAPGVYCLIQDLETAGGGIEIQADDVVIDCNHHKIEADPGSTASGVLSATGKSRLAVRRCTILGFQRGIDVSGGNDHIIEENRLAANKIFGIRIGDASQPSNGALIRHNQVVNTGDTGLSFAHGIVAHGQSSLVQGNHVAVVTSSGLNTAGIDLIGMGHSARGNTVLDIRSPTATGLRGGHVVQDNTVVAAVGGGSFGIDSPSAICRGNDVVGFGVSTDPNSLECSSSLGNLIVR